MRRPPKEYSIIHHCLRATSPIAPAERRRFHEGLLALTKKGSEMNNGIFFGWPPHYVRPNRSPNSPHGSRTRGFHGVLSPPRLRTVRESQRDSVPKAQGCEERATLGHCPSNLPNRNAVGANPFPPARLNSATTPLALFPFPNAHPR